MSAAALKQICKPPQFFSLIVFSNDTDYISSPNFNARVKMVGIVNTVYSKTIDHLDTFLSDFFRNSVKCDS